MKNTLSGLPKIIAILVALGIAVHLWYASAQDNPGSSGSVWGAILALAIIVAAVIVYFVPYSLAKKRDTLNKTVIFWINFLFGWTVLGWCFALLLASTSQTMASKEIEEETLRRLKQ